MTGFTQQPAVDHSLRHAQAIETAKNHLSVSRSQPSALVRQGDAFLRAGKCDEAIQYFEQAIAARPEIEPQLWQYGISLFFVERFDDAKRLFEIHRRVNPHDVENAAWHFLCVSKVSDVTDARKLLLPAPGDRRIPMKQILKRLRGGNATKIDETVLALKDSPEHSNAKFYADLYVGLIADAEGDVALAKSRMHAAAETPQTHYMADVARVYDSLLRGRREISD